MIWAVGIGPGDLSLLTEEAAAVLGEAEVVIGYRPYLELLGPVVEGKEVEASGMRKEVDRCRRALELHREGRRVAVVSSGDAGVYGMAGLLMELDPEADVHVVPGVTACQAAAARLGAPLMNDFVVLSLSDLLTPREEVLRRIEAVAAADLVTCLYNPTSKRRRPLFEEAVARFLAHRGPGTPVGWVRNAYRDEEQIGLTDLDSLTGEPIDMWTLVIVGSGRTEVVGGKLVTRRGYVEKYLEEDAGREAATAEPAIAGGRGSGPTDLEGSDSGRRAYVLGGTSFARGVVEGLEGEGWTVRVSVASDLGEEELEERPTGGVQVGKLDAAALAAELTDFGATALVDAAHPYAVEAHETARRAAEAAGTPLVRAGRPSWDARGEARVRVFGDADGLVRALENEGRRPFVTMGAKGLLALADAAVPLAARVLPTEESLRLAATAGIGKDRLVAAYPPYDASFTAACVRQFGCDVIVSKESGREGGMDEKLEAAREAGVELWMVARPDEGGEVCRDATSVAAALEEVWRSLKGAVREGKDA